MMNEPPSLDRIRSTECKYLNPKDNEFKKYTSSKLKEKNIKNKGIFRKASSIQILNTEDSSKYIFFYN